MRSAKTAGAKPSRSGIKATANGCIRTHGLRSNAKDWLGRGPESSASGTTNNDVTRPASLASSRARSNRPIFRNPTRNTSCFELGTLFRVARCFPRRGHHHGCQQSCDHPFGRCRPTVRRGKPADLRNVPTVHAIYPAHAASDLRRRLWAAVVRMSDMWPTEPPMHGRQRSPASWRRSADVTVAARAGTVRRALPRSHDRIDARLNSGEEPVFLR